jgi:hypothetical protein
VQLLLGEVIALGFFYRTLKLYERIFVQPLIDEGQVDDLTQISDVLDRGVVGAVADCFEVELKIGNELRGSVPINTCHFCRIGGA